MIDKKGFQNILNTTMSTHHQALIIRDGAEDISPPILGTIMFVHVVPTAGLCRDL